MMAYLFRRLLQMIPTVFGVILITFVLFNVVGGSPAAMTLGKNLSPKILEEFDEQRGFNKPLFFGRWTKTRAWPDWQAGAGLGPWRAMGDLRVRDDAGVQFVELHPGVYRLPLAFGLNAGEVYHWRWRYRLPEAGVAILAADSSADGKEVQLLPLAALPALNTGKAGGWRECVVSFTNPPAPAKLCLEVRGGTLEVAALDLRRATRGWFDSQFVFYLRQLARFDFGVSNYSNQRISQMLREGLLPSLSLTVPIFFGGLIISICVALLCAFFRDSWLDRGVVVATVMLMSLNYIVWIIFGQYLLAYRLGLFPIWGYENWRYLLLPVFIGIVSGLGENIRFYRTIMLDELYRDYVRTAFAKGVSRRGVLFKHVLKNAMIPILTNVVVAIPFLYTGSLLLEGFFGIPGLGGISINAINFSDVEVIRAVVFIGAVLYVIANLLTDLAYALVDPRVRLR